MEVDKFINLAALSLQVDFGDYEPTLHSLDLLRSLPLLPPVRSPNFDQYFTLNF